MAIGEQRQRNIIQTPPWLSAAICIFLNLDPDCLGL